MKEIKCVVWDLDNTLWDGILLEDKDVTLKEDIPNIIKTLDSRGILNSISSKNDFVSATEKLKEFNLLDYFLYPEINWNNKSDSIKSIAKNLNIGLDSIMFVDDQQYERDEVSFAIPEVVCVDAMQHKQLLSNPLLNPRFITESSKSRRKLYIEDIKRKIDEEKFLGPKEDFLKSLNMELCIKPAREEDLARLEELTIRTHQLNTTGITYDYEDLKRMIYSEQFILFAAELKDNYGSYGKIGLVLIEKLKGEWRIKLFILSCRVMTRGIGTVVLNEIMKTAKLQNLRLSAEFIHTQKNRVMYIALKFANFIEDDANTTSDLTILNNDLSIINKATQFINVKMEFEWN